jgi:hypothetical protein
MCHRLPARGARNRNADLAMEQHTTGDPGHVREAGEASGCSRSHEATERRTHSVTELRRRTERYQFCVSELAVSTVEFDRPGFDGVDHEVGITPRVPSERGPYDIV